MEKPMIFPMMRHSDEAEKGAEELIDDIKTGRLKMPIDPALRDDSILNKILETCQRDDYGDFLRSDIGQTVLNALDDDMVSSPQK